MFNLMKRIGTFLASEDGPTAVEYAVMLALIIIVCVGAVELLGGNTSDSFADTAAKMPP